MKTYLPNETKEQRKARKAREKAEKVVQEIAPSSNNNRYVACLKWGNKYSAEYVNRLYNMVKRNLTLEHEFVCFTEDPTGIDKHIRIEPLPVLPIQGWWYKPYMLSNQLPFTGTLLFFDLDVVVFKNIDKLFEYSPGKFCIIRDFNRSMRKTWDRMNSSVFRTQVGQYNNHYDDFVSNTKLHLSKNRGDQDWMYRQIKDHEFWPDEWIQSYKWEMRDRSKLQLVNGKRNFVDTAHPKVKPQTSVAVFHGEPNPADCKDKWVLDNWK